MSGGVGAFNGRGVWSIYKFEMHRFARTLWTGLAVPVITTSLYFIVFGAAIGSRMTEINGIDYGSFIVPGLMMLSLFTESIFNASFGIHMPRFTGTIYELLSAPLSAFETVLGYVGAAATKSTIVALVILLTAHLFVDVRIEHPVWMLMFLLLVAATFCLFGFIVGVWAKGFEQLQVIPLLIVTPLTFLGGAFYSIDMLGEPWRSITLFNPVVYLINGFRWTFFGQADVPVLASLAATLAFFLVCLGAVWWIFRTGYRLKS
jgi:ABC-2 type transport system permease protein